MTPTCTGRHQLRSNTESYWSSLYRSIVGVADRFLKTMYYKKQLSLKGWYQISFWINLKKVNKTYNLISVIRICIRTNCYIIEADALLIFKKHPFVKMRACTSAVPFSYTWIFVKNAFITGMFRFRDHVLKWHVSGSFSCREKNDSLHCGSEYLR